MSNIPVADAHCDFLYYMTQDGWDINRPTRNQAVALPYIKQGGGKLLFFAAWVDMDMRKDCLQQALDMFDSYFTMMEENDVFVPLTKDYTPDGDKIATVLTVEGGESLNAAISNVRLFHRLGDDSNMELFQRTRFTCHAKGKQGTDWEGKGCSA